VGGRARIQFKQYFTLRQRVTFTSVWRRVEHRNFFALHFIHQVFVNGFRRKVIDRYFKNWVVKGSVYIIGLRFSLSESDMGYRYPAWPVLAAGGLSGCFD